VSLRKVSPLLAIRQSYEPVDRRWRDPWLGVIYVLMLGVLVLFSLYYTEKRVQGWAFAGGLLVTAGILLALARAIMFVARRLVRLPLAFPWRQGIANLHRPNNRTALLMLSLGLGTFFHFDGLPGPALAARSIGCGRLREGGRYGPFRYSGRSAQRGH
jgi:putative ABC transport system permease protein